MIYYVGFDSRVEVEADNEEEAIQKAIPGLIELINGSGEFSVEEEEV